MSLIENRREQIFPVLDANQIETAKRFASGPPQTFGQGATIFNVGDRHASAWLVLQGEIVITRRDGLNAEAEIARMGVGQFTGEMSELSGRGTLASGRAGPDGCTALPFEAAHIRALIVGSAELGEILMRAFILRRVGLLQADGAGSVLIGSPARPTCGRLQNFLSRNGYPCTVLDAAVDEEGRALVERLGIQPDELPVMVCPNGTVLKRPTDAEAGMCLGITPGARHRPSCTTWPWSAPGPRASRLRSMPRPKVCRCWCSTIARLAARRAPRRGSRTISAFRPAFPAGRWPDGRSARR